MVNKVLVTEQYLTDIADAIRSKTNSNSSFTPAQMANAISSISGSAPLVLGAVRPDAQLVQTYTYDKYLVADEEIEIPAYTTTATSLKAADTLATLNYDASEYYYYVTCRALVIPEYSITTLGKGRFEFSALTALNELYYPDPVTISNKTYTSLIGVSTVSNATCAYWSSASALTRNHTGAYGTYLIAPTISASASGTTITITIATPEFRIRGSGTYLASTFFNALSDIRYQYIIQVYRIPVNSLNLHGWGQQMQFNRILDCYTNGGTLT